jgi:GTPase
MLDEDFSIAKNQQAAVVSLLCSKLENHETEEQVNHSLNEMKELLRTLDVPTVLCDFQKKEKIDPATLLGKGKLEEIGEEAKRRGATLLVFDLELSASQIRNVKKITGLDVVDRCHVILEIFSQHARTREARIQIEIARLQYILPRLTGFWTHLGRQKGGVGVRGGEGEQQIELDRRIIRKKIERYKDELVEVRSSRQEQKKKRQNKAITAALVGYTNAGKSSLMNRLCKVNVLEENKLFATLDSTYRMLNPDTKPPMILIDTVGFISNLPNTLIDGFKTTLESAMEADLLIIVCDLADANFENHLKVTTEVLKELNVEGKEQIIVFNKKDLITDPFKVQLARRLYKDSFVVSSHNKEDMDELRTYIINHFLGKQSPYDLFVPYQLGDVHSIVMSKTNIIRTVNHEDGIFYRVKIPSFMFNSLNLNAYLIGPSDFSPL